MAVAATIAVPIVVEATNHSTHKMPDRSPIDDFYTGMAIVHGGQVRTITGYNGATKTATLSSPWATSPSSNDSVFVVSPYGIIEPGSEKLWKH